MANITVPNLPVAISLTGAEAVPIIQTGTMYRTTTGAIAALASPTTGTVSSVGLSGGTTGLIISNSPVTSVGTMTIGGTVSTSAGGTGANTTFTAGSIVFAGTSGIYSQNNANLYWDNTNGRLGVGTTTPSYKLDVNGTARFAGTTSALAEIITNIAEPATVSATAATGTIAFYPSTQSVLYYTTAASANWTTNITFSAGTTMNTARSTGQSLTVVFLVTQGATPYYNNVVQVDGATSGVTTYWQGGAPTSGNASGVDIYAYTIIKTGSATFTVFASQTQFK